MLRRSLIPLLPLLAAPAAAQIAYRAKLDPKGESWVVEGRIENPGKGDIDYWFPRWTAGAYHLADYGRAAKDVEASGDQGEALQVERVSPSEMRISAAGEPFVTVRYHADSLAGDSSYSNGVIDVEANRIRKDYAFLNPPSLFGFVPSAIDEQVRLRLDLPEGWKAACILPRGEDGSWVAPSWYRFEDSPLLLAPDLDTSDFEVDGKPIRVAVEGADHALAQDVTSSCERIVRATSQMLGGLPYSDYEFLVGFVPEGGGSGLEHSFSTLILVHPGTPVGMLRSILAHEHLHAWCGERIHAVSIERPDYTKPVETGTIWFNEGFTQYLTQHVLLRAGMLDRAGFFTALLERPPIPSSMLSGSLTSVSREAAEGMNSMMGLMKFAAKMYTTGPRVALALDLAMRKASGGERGVVDLVEEMETRFADQHRGFPEDGLFDEVQRVCGADLSDFEKRYVDGSEEPDLGALLGTIGYSLADGKAVELPAPTPAQLAARADFFGVQEGSEKTGSR